MIKAKRGSRDRAKNLLTASIWGRVIIVPLARIGVSASPKCFAFICRHSLVACSICGPKPAMPPMAKKRWSDLKFLVPRFVHEQAQGAPVNVGIGLDRFWQHGLSDGEDAAPYECAHLDTWTTVAACTTRVPEPIHQLRVGGSGSDGRLAAPDRK